MTEASDLPVGWNYVSTSVVWHIAEDVRPHTPGDLALCGKQAHWKSNTRDAWPVGKLCRSCRTAWRSTVDIWGQGLPSATQPPAGGTSAKQSSKAADGPLSMFYTFVRRFWRVISHCGDKPLVTNSTPVEMSLAAPLMALLITRNAASELLDA